MFGWICFLPPVPVIELRLNLPVASFPAGHPLAVRDVGNGLTKPRIAAGYSFLDRVLRRPTVHSTMEWEGAGRVVPIIFDNTRGR